MCLAVPGKVLQIDGKNATVDILGVKRQVSIDFVPDAIVGDYLIIHAGYAIEKVDIEEAQRTIELYRELGDLMQGFGEHD